MKTCKHCKQRVTGTHDCKAAGRTIDTDSMSDLVDSFFGDSGSSDGGCDSGADSGSCGD